METLRQVTNIRAIEDRKVTFTFSDETRDRHGTVIKLSAWNLDNFNKNPIASYQHEAYGNPDPDMIIGKASAQVDKAALIGDIEFESADINPLADKLLKKVKSGSLNTVSVGFIENKGHWGLEEDGEDTGTYYFDSVDLVEISLVSVPSNPNATAFRNFVDAKEKPKIEDKGVDDGVGIDAFHYRMRKLELTALTRGNK